MSVSYSYTNLDFVAITQHDELVIPHELQYQIEHDVQIVTAINHISQEYLEEGISGISGIILYNTYIYFESGLTGPEKTQLDTIVATFRQRVINDTDIFDAIVDSKWNGDYVSISEAFQNGEVSVYVRDGFYNETQDIIIPDGGQLVGESQGNVIINLANGNSVICDGSSGIKETTGTISVDSGSQGVTGTGTTFTNLTPGQFILLEINYFEIESIQSDTHLILKQAYQGKSITNNNLIAQSMYTGVRIENLIINGSSSTGFYCRGVRNYGISNLAVVECTPNILIVDSADASFNQIVTHSSTGSGMQLDNVHSILLSCINTYNNSLHGIYFSNNSVSNIIDCSSSTSNNFDGIHVSGFAMQTNISDCVLKGNRQRGVYTSTTSENIIVSNCELINNGTHGIELFSNNSIITGNIIKNNTNDGLQIYSENNVVSNNIVMENENGLNVADGARDIGLSSNNVLYNTASGILVDIGATKVLVIYNILRGNVTNITNNNISTTLVGNLLSV
jgi:hypothetical protein